MFKNVGTKAFWLILGGICIQISCNTIEKPVSSSSVSSLSAEVKQHKNAVTIEIFTVPIAPYQNELLRQLWQEVDEQSLPPQLRRELLAQGFRVGIIGNLLSPALAQLLNITSDAQAETAWGNFQKFSVADAVNESATSRNLRVLLPGMRSLIKIFDDTAELPELPLLWNEGGEICGQTYQNALGLFCVSATANKDGSAQMQIIPELEHGVIEDRFRSISGMVVQERGRPRRTFEALTISQHLLPGQWLLLGTTTPDSAGVGKSFFIRKNSELEQRVLAIRLVNATSDSSYSAVLSPSLPQKAEAVMPERY